MISSTLHRPIDRAQAVAPNAIPADDQPAFDGTGVADAGPPRVEDGVISDARRRARHRRVGYAIIAALAVGLVAFAMFGAPATIPEQTSDDGDAPSVAPGAIAGAEIVGEWHRIHVGWIYVYADGRVISSPDSGHIKERHLTPLGVGLVRAGDLEPFDLFTNSSSAPADVWSDPTPSEYRPSRYALCHDDASDRLRDVGSMLGRLPQTLQVLLRGTERTTRSFAGTGDRVECFVVSPALAEAVWALSDPRDQDEMLLDDQSFAMLPASDGGELEFVFGPILPHGGWVYWQG